MKPKSKIQVWNRETGALEEEKVYGAEWIQWAYGSKFGRRVSENFLVKPLPSKLYGWLQSSPFSKSKIQPFIQEYSIPMREYEKGPFKSFNDFFIRQFAPGARQFSGEPTVMPAFAEGRYLGWKETQTSLKFPVKGEHLTPEALLQNHEIAQRFRGGALLIARLCPVDYHRFHFPDSGRVLFHYRVPGALDSVNPWALREKSEIFCKNERQVTVLETDNFGWIAYVEVGALCVGRIVQSHPSLKNKSEKTFARGDEKGYFLFGGSTVIVLGEAGRWIPASDILYHTAQETEVYVKLGQKVGEAV